METGSITTDVNFVYFTKAGEEAEFRFPKTAFIDYTSLTTNVTTSGRIVKFTPRDWGYSSSQAMYEAIEPLFTGQSESGGNTVLEGNSTETPLSAGQTFTGEWVDVSGFNSIVGAVKTDQNGEFIFEYSTNKLDVDSTLTRYYRTNQIEVPHRFTNARQYCRVKYTNTSASDQTFIRLQVLAGEKAPLNVPTDSVIAQDYDATVVRPTDFHTEVALGRRQGVETWNKFGYNDDIDTGAPEIIAAWGGAFQYLTAGETIDIVSTDAADTLAGTGAQRIIIWGVDQDWNPVTEVVEMNGVTPVTTTSQWIGINRISIFKAGTGLMNAGDISVKATTSGYDMALMPIGEGTSQQMIFYVPVGHQFLAEWLYFNTIKISGGGGQPEVTFKGWVYSDVATAEFEVFRAALDVADNNNLDITPPTPFVIGEKSILWFEAETDTDNTAVRGRFSGELFRNPNAEN